MELSVGQVNRPRNVGWLQAAALLYGDWGTSKAYVIGIGLAIAGYAAFPYLMGVVLLTFVVGINYIWVCKYYPNGGGVYAAAKTHGSRLAVVGALLLLADYVVTASLSCLEAFHYFNVKDPQRWAVIMIYVLGILNFFGPKFTGHLAVYLAGPTVIVISVLIGAGFMHGGEYHWVAPQGNWTHHWGTFVGMILALSGVEAIANTTGVMPLDPGSTPEKPSVHRSSRRAIIIVMFEVCVMTGLLALLALALPPESHKESEGLLRYMGERYLGPTFGWVVGGVIGLLLLSAVNTAIVASVSVMYVMAQDREFPPVFRMLNRYGVPWVPLIAAVMIPALVLELFREVSMLASLYAIGVVGAIALNLGSCGFNRALPMKKYERAFMLGTAAIMIVVWITIAATKHDALLFAVVMIGAGLAIRELNRKANTEEGQGAVVTAQTLVEGVTPESGQQTRLLVAARGMSTVLFYALDEAKLRQASLSVLYIKEVAVASEVMGTLEDNPQAKEFFDKLNTVASTLGVSIVPLYGEGNDPSAMIVNMAKSTGSTMVYVGATRRSQFVNFLKGDIIRSVAAELPSKTKLVIIG